MTEKHSLGNFFEDLYPGLEIIHATPRTITEGDQSLYIALTASRYPLHCDAEFAKSLGFRRELVNDLLTFHIVFGNSVPDISLNAIANLGYSDVRFSQTVYPGDTLKSTTTVLARKESSKGDAGVVWVKTIGTNQHDEVVLSFIRWVLVAKQDKQSKIENSAAIDTINQVDRSNLFIPSELNLNAFSTSETGGNWFWDDYAIGERIYHVEGVAIEEAEHQMAARLYQNTARAHFNAYALKDSLFGKRVVYGGHIISIARELSYNGLENVLKIVACNGGTHSNPTFAGDTIFAWTDVIDSFEVDNQNLGALRLRLIALKNLDPMKDSVDIKIDKDGREVYNPAVVLDYDYTVLVPKK
tara:strand:+ start:33768 stop:34835 length:1068 start_codon:yes stop_codon:yes gene_type:complete